MTLSVFRFLKEGKGLLTDKRAFYDALGRAEPTAIRVLAGKISGDVKKVARQAGLSVEDAEELVNDAVVITISNIRNQTFLFTDFSPAAYAHGVVRKLIANRIRSQKPKHEELEDVHLFSEFNPDTYLSNKELEAMIGLLLGKLEPNCRQLLQLKYFENLRDKEIIEQGLTSYTATTSLKSRRSQCLNKLIELARETGLLDHF